MDLQDIYQYFQSPHPIYLAREETVCYMLAVLLDEGDSDALTLMNSIGARHPSYRLSNTIFYSAVQFLTDEEIIRPYWQKLSGRGRPKRMYTIQPKKWDEAKQLAQLWRQSLSKDHRTAKVKKP